jgi:hypothetical protein
MAWGCLWDSDGVCRKKGPGMRPEKSLRRIDRENCTWAVQAAFQNSACTIIRKMSVMRPTAAKELRHVNFKEYYFGFFQQHDYRFFYRL